MLPTIESLKNLGVNIISSEVVQELHIDSEGKSYKQKLREDTFTNGAYSPLICLFYHQSGIKFQSPLSRGTPPDLTLIHI